MVKENITINNPERFLKDHTISKTKLINAVQKATDKLEENTKKYGIRFPGTCTVDYRYQWGENKNWECGMFTGCYWLAYELTENKFFKDVAEKHFETYIRRLDEKIGMDDHDVGFVFIPSCISQYRITGNEKAKDAALKAAKYLFEKSYSKEGKFIIRMHGAWDVGAGCRTMMDSLMNAPLFMWAGKELGDEEMFLAGVDHNLTTEKYLIREDASSFHHYQFDPKTAGPVNGLTFQGHADDSCWSRGHSWGVYGFPITYGYTKDERFKELHKNITYFMLNHLPDDFIPYWDYDFTSGDEPRDSSAGVISLCGMMEMNKYLSDTSEIKTIYKNASAKILEATIDKCTNDSEKYDGLICHVTHALPQGQGIDECAAYGDYFYLEALHRFTKGNNKLYW